MIAIFTVYSGLAVYNLNLCANLEVHLAGDFNRQLVVQVSNALAVLDLVRGVIFGDCKFGLGPHHLLGCVVFPDRCPGKGKGLYKTDANGGIRISGLVGTLVITETKPLPGYVMDEGTRTQTVKVNASDTQTITVYNTKIGGLTIIKKDEETGERIKGVQFEVRKLNGEIVGTYTTDRSGVISLPEAEKGWYQVTELKAAKGYQLDSQPYQIEVKDGSTATLEITNRQTGSALIHKIDSVTG